MEELQINDTKIGKVVYYIPSHKDKISENAERGVIVSLRGNLIYVRYTTGDTAALTKIEDLYV